MSELLLSDVSRWYGNVVAVNDVTMTIGPGITGLLGPNGAGKSTLLSMMAGLLPPSKGTVTIADLTAGEDVRPGTEIATVNTLRDSYPVSALHGGQVLEWLVDDGDPVAPGQPILRLYPTEL